MKYTVSFNAFSSDYVIMIFVVDFCDAIFSDNFFCSSFCFIYFVPFCFLIINY
jgi:hypothetical protein